MKFIKQIFYDMPGNRNVYDNGKDEFAQNISMNADEVELLYARYPDANNHTNKDNENASGQLFNDIVKYLNYN